MLPAPNFVGWRAAVGLESRVTLAALEPQPTLPAPAHVRSEALALGEATMRDGARGRSVGPRGPRAQG
jgi:hypothetical protein